MLTPAFSRASFCFYIPKSPIFFFFLLTKWWEKPNRASNGQVRRTEPCGSIGNVRSGLPHEAGAYFGCAPCQCPEFGSYVSCEWLGVHLCHQPTAVSWASPGVSKIPEGTHGSCVCHPVSSSGDYFYAWGVRTRAKLCPKADRGLPDGHRQTPVTLLPGS